MNIETWRKNAHSETFDLLKKGTLLTVEGYFKPEEWNDSEGVKHNRIVMVATQCHLIEEKAEEAPAEPAKKTTRKGKK